MRLSRTPHTDLMLAKLEQRLAPSQRPAELTEEELATIDALACVTVLIIAVALILVLWWRGAYQ